MRLIRGAPGSGKTALVFREFREALRAGDVGARIVVPTATLVRHFQHELARDGEVFAPGAVVSLSRFTRELAAPLTLIPEGALRAIVREKLDRLKLADFAAVAGTAGMAEVILETIALFENSGATPDQLASVRRLSPRARAFERIWRATSEAVKAAGFVLRGELVRGAAMNVTNSAQKIWLDGFLTFSPLERELIGALARNTDLTLTLPDSSAADEVRAFAIQLGAEDRPLSGVARKPRTTVIEASSPEREADEIARRVIDLRTQTTPFRNVAVALRDTDVYLPLLRSTFDRFGIPARFYFASPLRSHSAALFLGNLIRCVLDGWDFSTVIDMIAAHPQWGHSADRDRLDFDLRQAMPDRGSAAVLKLCEGRRIVHAIEDWAKTESWSPDALKPAEWAWRLTRLAESQYRPGLLDAPRTFADVETARSHVAAVRAWVHAVESAVEAVSGTSSDRDRPIALADFWRAAEDAIESAVVDVPDLRGDVVHVMNAYEARQWDVRALFVCGMTDRDYPRPLAQNLLFPDADLPALRRAGITLRSAAERDREEEALFTALRSRASDELVLSYATHDTAGKSREASRYLPADTERAEAMLIQPAARVERPGRAIRGRVASAPLREHIATKHAKIGLTALEDLTQCRFLFFGRRSLDLLGPPERPGERLQPRVTGSILHHALEKWQLDRTRDFVELYEEAFDEERRKLHLPPGYRLEVDRIAFREIARKVSANDRWTPDGEHEVEKELTLAFPHDVSVTCRIDRIDRFGNDCVILDYKSGKTANVEKLLNSRTKLQGPLYALAVREAMGLNPVAFLYWAVREDKLYGWGRVPGTNIVEKEIPENWATEARDLASARLEEYFAGAVHPHPEEPGKCRWCDFKGACRVEQKESELIMIGGGAAG